MSRPSPFLIVRCDASPEIGVGHVSRCLAFAGLWPDPAKVLFISDLGGTGLADRIRSAGYALSELTQSRSGNSDENWIEFVCHAQSSVLLLDGYHFGPDLQKRLRLLVKKLIVWDDYNHLAEYHAHVILNDGPGFQPQDYNAPPDTVFLLGSEYILLRSEFLACSGSRGRTAASVATNILVSFGGADPKGFALEALGFFSKLATQAESEPVARTAEHSGCSPRIALAVLPRLHIKIVTGAAYARLPELRKLVQELNSQWEFRGSARQTGQASPLVEILHNVSDMPDLMLWADLALGAGGGTAFELCYLGVPQLLCVAAENQKAVAHWLTAEGAAFLVESFSGLPMEKFCGFLYDRERRQAMSQAAAKLVDGLGRERLRRFILKLC